MRAYAADAAKGFRLAHPLESKLALALSLSAEEVRRLRDFETAPTPYKRGDTILSEGDPQSSFFIVKRGWVSCARHLQNGRRQITSFNAPGDLIGLDVVVKDTALQEVAAVTDAEIVAVPLAQLTALCRDAPRLGLALVWESAQRESMLAEKLVSLGRRSAMERLAHFFVETYHRLEGLGLLDEGRVFLPVTKETLGDAMGVTTIHVYRTLRKLSEAGLIRFEDSQLEIFDLKGLRAVAQYSANYLEAGGVPNLSKRTFQ